MSKLRKCPRAKQVRREDAKERRRRDKGKAGIKRGSTKPKGINCGETKDEGRDTRKEETPN